MKRKLAAILRRIAERLSPTPPGVVYTKRPDTQTVRVMAVGLGGGGGGDDGGFYQRVRREGVLHDMPPYFWLGIESEKGAHD